MGEGEVFLGIKFFLNRDSRKLETLKHKLIGIKSAADTAYDKFLSNAFVFREGATGWYGLYYSVIDTTNISVGALRQVKLINRMLLLLSHFSRV